MKGLVLCLAIAAFACGGKKKNAAESKANPAESKADSKAIDIFVNTDLAPHLANVVAARSGYQGMQPTEIDSQPDKVRYFIREVAAPLMSKAVAGASALTPPPAAKDVHEAALSLWKKERDLLAAMAAATDPVDADKFKASLAQLMALQDSITSWDKKLQALLDDNGGLKLKRLPDVWVPAPGETTAPGADAKADVTPTQCKAGTAMGSPSGDGTFQCMTEMTFNPPPSAPAGTPKESVLLCGPGTLQFQKDGTLLMCISQAAITVGDAKIAAGSAITLDPSGTRVTVMDPDRAVCFDAAGKPAKCPEL